MKEKLKLYMVMLGCTPEGRFTEQHDIFFGIGYSLKELIPKILKEIAAIQNGKCGLSSQS